MDNKKKKGYQDDIQIDSKDPGELRYRARRWNVSTGAILVAMHQTKSRHPALVYYWLWHNWPRITGINVSPRL